MEQLAYPAKNLRTIYGLFYFSVFRSLLTTILFVLAFFLQYGRVLHTSLMLMLVFIVITLES